MMNCNVGIAAPLHFSTAFCAQNADPDVRRDMEAALNRIGELGVLLLLLLLLLLPLLMMLIIIPVPTMCYQRLCSSHIKLVMMSVTMAVSPRVLE